MVRRAGLALELDHLNGNPVAAAAFPDRVKRLMNVADEVNGELEGSKLLIAGGATQFIL
ncbi:hypothetical protein NLM33_36375 [Bradyrhizobium sp. CCGUVB1N3]|nr:hypothetical protein [Bradyrhizobium sp. CCGUVB1N3]MCP3475737.1 hypothetical protein [Bradyrhizobium sp. CCGUVB1N3]